jgi:hypothetical protein
MAIEELLAVVPPPKDPVDCGSPELWPKVLNEVGVALPEDLREIGMHYGSGRFANGEIEVFNPFYEGYLANVNAVLRGLGDAKQGMPSDEFPYDIFPKIPGLFPWGWDNNGNTMTCLTEAECSQWITVLVSRSGGFEQWDCTLTTFLAKALNNEIKCRIWPRFDPSQRTFHQGRNQAEVYADYEKEQRAIKR